ncbi:type II toxin-antitoxin system mRNA interferase toxin, RelE/StbE family [Verminephrobacter aporrectodeae subsp. tuberculatae]|uniref:Type II toxin-antitoxin system mRNA interferase toxin, RelE/StbE family n=1 Tax=Verminephrobacter aporrectodeae subsp. tuberculatae TaxID=1110392 RepID=A0ABT3KZF5_9BURK|nr:type II toxin-antitoxin system mRNA interferase toxin, RelE/StbE family [Verminephrobacter aporrectodeae]MCW5219673.1 type II toxin-antitoxin system mRNA interferase toxin, RelE/StbE family [Verminephrobacter aporrectodeae subsp. tuberculatae]MCW5258627.1 type II toxin-antitoxin system mRNA interferase toxin, RelE/StbE family [Verminephrobacter aporrectodeae subsp. tuberculatae]MCW5287629.1 type II toxin-antitoxin system mRNA interferase toxin, RelE/StbE family [Verminephrobacter aporrectodea
MLPIEWSDEAQLDLAEIQFYIEQFNPAAAQDLRQTIEQGVERFLPLVPFGLRPGRVRGTREYVVHPNYIVVYRVEQARIHVLRVLHARQEYP